MLLFMQGHCQYMISGWVKDSLTGSVLTGAHVYDETTAIGCIVGDDGKYRLVVDSGLHHLRVSHIGYQTKYLRFYTTQGTRKVYRDFHLVPKDFQGKTVIVSDQRVSRTEDNQMGVMELHMETVKKMPAFMGESDVLKSMQLLPGIQSTGEGSSGFHVRGGGIDQNLLLLDNIKLYNVGHLFGFFSVFNADAVHSAEMMKGDIPAEHGGRLSSVLKVSMPNGNDRHYIGKVGLGLIFSDFCLEGPIVKNKASFLIAGRRTYVDKLIQPFLKPTSSMKGMKFYFYDLNGKLTWKPNPKNHLSLTFYNGSDDYGFRTQGGAVSTTFRWDNTAGGLQWWHFFKNNDMLNTQVAVTDYNFHTTMLMDIYRLNIHSGLRDYQFRSDMHKEWKGQQWIGGMEYIFHDFAPNQYDAKSGDIIMDFQKREPLYAHDAALFLSDEFNIGQRWKVKPGLRLSYFQHTGPYTQYLLNEVGQVIDTVFYANGKRVKDYAGLEPRLSLRYIVDSNKSVKAAYNHCYQYVQQVCLSSVSLPTDAWIPSTAATMPQSCDQMAIGWYQDFQKQDLHTSVEAYYKKMRNMTEYKAGFSPFNEAAYGYSNPYTQGDGWSYGIECFAQKNTGRWKGWIAYTLSWSYRQFEQLNGGKVFCAKNDRRHDISILLSYDILPKLNASAVWVYATGNTMTLPVGYYFIGYNIVVEYSGTNAYRMDPYHRLDISLRWQLRQSKHCDHSLLFSIYNVYNRKNPFFISIQTTMEGTDLHHVALQSQAYQMSLFPILPSISWNIAFK